MRRLSLLVVCTIFFAFIFSIALAHESEPDQSGPIPSPVDYVLPYPGLLPGHPFFFVKELRDVILLKLISSPIRKVEFLVLMADKRLNMTINLVDSGKLTQAVSNAKRGIQHMHEAQNIIFTSTNTDVSAVNNLKDRYELSLRKHAQIYDELAGSVEAVAREDFVKLHAEADTLYGEFLAKR